MKFCINCGCEIGKGNSFCPNCGKPVNHPDAVVCVYCGTPLKGGLQATPSYRKRSRIAAGLLGIFMGSLGVHNFYLGYTGKAVAQLLITFLTCGAGAVISGLWGFIEGMMILSGSINRDGNGHRLKDD